MKFNSSSKQGLRWHEKWARLKGKPIYCEWRSPSAQAKQTKRYGRRSTRPFWLEDAASPASAAPPPRALRSVHDAADFIDVLALAVEFSAASFSRNVRGMFRELVWFV